VSAKYRIFATPRGWGPASIPARFVDAKTLAIRRIPLH
jgi:hypothetical protein